MRIYPLIQKFENFAIVMFGTCIRIFMPYCWCTYTQATLPLIDYAVSPPIHPARTVSCKQM